MVLIKRLFARSLLTGVLISCCPGVSAQAANTRSETGAAVEIVAVDLDPKRITIEAESGVAEVLLAEHLRKIGAEVYSAYNCIHCFRQFFAFGQQAFSRLRRIECSPEGENARLDLCDRAKIPGYPTWKIRGKLYPGLRSLEELAKLSRYQGPLNFKKLEPTVTPRQYQTNPATSTF